MLELTSKGTSYNVIEDDGKFRAEGHFFVKDNKIEDLYCVVLDSKNPEECLGRLDASTEPELFRRSYAVYNKYMFMEQEVLDFLKHVCDEILLKAVEK